MKLAPTVNDLRDAACGTSSAGTMRINRTSSGAKRFSRGSVQEALQIGLAVNWEKDFLGAYGLVYQQYETKGYEQPNASRLHTTFWSALPNTYLVVARKNGKTVGTVSFIVDSPARLPSDDVAAEAVDAIRADGRRVCEISALAVDENQVGCTTALKLFQYGLRLVMDVHKVTDIVITVNPRHVQFYQKALQFKQIGPEKAYGRVQDAPGVPMRLDLVNVRSECRDKFDNVARHRKAEKFFFKEREEEIRSQYMTELPGRAATFTENRCREFFEQHTDHLAALEDRNSFDSLWAVGRKQDGTGAGEPISPMRTRRPLAINNGLCHGICNYNCRLCGVNKKSYCGPQEFQPKEVTEKLIARVEQAARAGICIRYIANAGDGEPTLHPEFAERMRLFGDMKRNWNAPVPAPEISVVTNGSNLNNPEVLKTLTDNPLTLIVSFPTSNPESYGTVMTGDASRGKAMLDKVVSGLDKVMGLTAKGKIDKLNFHVSPPEREIVRRDFNGTIDFLTGRAQKAGLGKIELVMFPATSNRSGLIRNVLKSTDMYRDLFRRYNGKAINGVTVELKLVLKRFFANGKEIRDLLRSFDYPCIWNANLFITPDGQSICCNDQAVRNPFGDIFGDDIAGLMHRKETYVPNRVCKGCDSAPQCVKGSTQAILFNLASRVRMNWARQRREACPPEGALPWVVNQAQS